MRTPFTLEDTAASRFICEPLRLLDYCLINDGGVAMILTTAERARDLRKPPVVHPRLRPGGRVRRIDVPAGRLLARADAEGGASDVYAMAGAGPRDMDALMIYDNFTPTVLFSLEGFGFCPVGRERPVRRRRQARARRRAPDQHRAAATCPSPTCRAGRSTSRRCARCAANAAHGRSRTAALVQYMTAAPVITSMIYGRDPQ